MSWKKTLIVAAIMLAAMGILRYASHSEAIHPNKPFSAFPKTIGQWQGKELHFSDTIYQVLGVDDSFLANYSHPDGSHIQLYIGFYQSQKEGDLIHSPKHCLPGSGWKIVKNERVRLGLEKGSRKESRVIKLNTRNQRQSQQVVLYWFHSRGRIISSEYWQKIYMVWDSIMRNRTDGSFVRLISPVVGEDEKQTTKKLKRFARELIPILDQYIPL